MLFKVLRNIPEIMVGSPVYVFNLFKVSSLDEAIREARWEEPHRG